MMRCCYFREILAVQCASLVLGTGNSAAAAAAIYALPPLHGATTSCSMCNSFVLQPICATWNKYPMSIYQAHAVIVWAYNIPARRAKELPNEP